MLLSKLVCRHWCGLPSPNLCRWHQVACAAAAPQICGPALRHITGHPHGKLVGMSAAPTGPWLSLGPRSPILPQRPSLPPTGKAERQLAEQSPVGGHVWRRMCIHRACNLPAACGCNLAHSQLPLPHMLGRYYTANVAGYPACNSGSGTVALSNDSALTPCTLGAPGCYGWTQVCCGTGGSGLGCPGVAAEVSSAAAAGAAWAKHVSIHSLAMSAFAAVSSYCRAAAAQARCPCRFAKHAPSPPRR